MLKEILYGNFKSTEYEFNWKELKDSDVVTDR